MAKKNTNKKSNKKLLFIAGIGVGEAALAVGLGKVSNAALKTTCLV